MEQNEQLKRAQVQRFISLYHAFVIIDSFAIPSLNPELLQKYKDVKINLLENYQEGISLKDTEKYEFP